jgi:hypothetical protein
MVQTFSVALLLSWTTVTQHASAVGGRWASAIGHNLALEVLVFASNRSSGALDSCILPPGRVPRLEVDVRGNADQTVETGWGL